MSDNPLALLIPPLSSPDAAEYDTICAAVMETARGRWFLAEYARRNQPTTTESGLAAIQRMEAAIGGEHAAQSFDRFHFDVVDMAQAIARAKAEIAAIKPDAEHDGKIEGATDELASTVQAKETAAARILAAAEHIQGIVRNLREEGTDEDFCGRIDAQVAEIHAAGSVQDLSDQRTQKAIQVLDFLQGRIDAMIDIWGKDIPPAPEPEEKIAAGPLTDAPSPPDAGLDAADIDGTTEPPAASAEERRDASIEDIGRLMMALKPLTAADVHENTAVPDETLAKEDVPQLHVAPAEAAVMEQPLEPSMMAPVSVENPDAVPETKPTLAIPKVEAEPVPSILERIQTALLFLPRSSPEAKAPEPVEATELTPAGVLDSAPVPAADTTGSIPQPTPQAEDAASENPPETASLSFELTMETVVASAIIQPTSVPPEAQETEAPFPPVPEDEPTPAMAALELEFDAFLFGPDPIPDPLSEVSMIIPKDEPGPTATPQEPEASPEGMNASPEELDPADFLLEPVPTGAAKLSFAALLAEALEQQAAASDVQPSELLPAAQLESTAIPEAAVGLARGTPEVSPALPSRPASKPAARTPNDPLAQLRALSDEEKIALFS